MMATISSFIDLNLNTWIIRQLQSIGLTKPTPIQENCIPAILKGQNCIGSAKTGSGKTLAFALPILQRLCEDPYGIFALVLTPTRELAFQIAEQFAVVGKTINLRVCVVVGGMDMVTQGLELARRPHIVVATPGRLADHLESCNTFTLKKLQFVVFDEADRLLSGQFSEQLETIFAALPVKKQVLLFSATITDDLKNVKEIADNEYFTWDCVNDVATVEELDQFYVLCPFDVRDSYLVETIRTFRQKSENGSIMIFTDTCKNCQLLSMTLNEVGFDNVSLHSMIPQKQRLAALTQFKSDVVRILIATDVASRGLDIPAVELVLNHTVPSNPKDYIHRVGRTARAGRGGTAISLVTPYDIRLVHAIEVVINTKLKEYKVDDKEVANIMTQVSVTKGEAEIKLDETNFYERKLINKRKKLILEGKDPDEEEENRRKYLKEKHKKRRKDGSVAVNSGSCTEKEEKLVLQSKEPDEEEVDKSTFSKEQHTKRRKSGVAAVYYSSTEKDKKKTILNSKFSIEDSKRVVLKDKHRKRKKVTVNYS